MTVASETVPALQTPPHAPAWAAARRGPRRPPATCPRRGSFAHGAARFPGSARRLPSSCAVRPSARASPRPQRRPERVRLAHAQFQHQGQRPAHGQA